MDIKLVQNRKVEVEQEIAQLMSLVDELKLEISDLEATLRVNERFSGAKRNPTSANNKSKPKTTTGAKPKGLPTVRKMILESLEVAKYEGHKGLTPKGIRDFINSKYGHNIKSQANTVAWTMWNRDEILKKDEELGIYMLLE